jgi:hypothetical protein
MRANLSGIMMGLGIVLTAVPALAHHSFSAEYDANQPMTLRGTLTKMEWINPHAWLYLDAKGPDGRLVNWAIECGAPQALFRRGWTKNSVTNGVELVVQGYRAKDGSLKVNGGTITLPDGRHFFAGSSGTGAPNDPSPAR